MKSWSKYLVVYKTNLLDVSEEIIFENVKMKIVDGPIKLNTPLRLARIIPAGEESTFLTSSELELGLGKFLAFEARTKSKDPVMAKVECQEAIEAVIAAVSMTYSSDLFDQLVYTGWIEDESKVNIEAWIKVANKQTLETKLIEKTYEKIDMMGSETRERFTLMSRLYNKSLMYDPGEEKFLLLWMILEIFPMMGQAQYHPIATYLSPVLKKDPAVIANTLNIKGMHSTRSKLVHSGRFDLSLLEVSDLLNKLELLIRTIMREMAGLDYDGCFNPYFEN